jgi:hypothetical protein
MLRFPHQNEVRFVLTSNYLQEYSCLIYVICVCLRIVVSNTYCVVFLFCLSSSCCQFLRIANFWLTLRYSLTYIYIKSKSTYETQHAWYTSLGLYPSILHIYSTQYNLENLVVQGCNTFTKVNQTFDDGNKCSFSCTKESTNGRRKRATSNDVYHACCVS